MEVIVLSDDSSDENPPSVEEVDSDATEEYIPDFSDIEPERKKSKKDPPPEEEKDILKKRLKPEEALKCMTVHVDKSVVDSAYGSMIVSALEKERVSYMIGDRMPSIVKWSKNFNAGDGFDVEDEEDILRFVLWSDFVEYVFNRDLVDKVKGWKRFGGRLVLVIAGMKKYWSYHREEKYRRIKTGRKQTQKTNEFDALPVITPGQVEEALVEVQIKTDCSHRFVDNSEDLADLIIKCTKSVSQIDWKRGQYSKESEALSWYAKGESKNCVKVDKMGHGLKELWRQQICQFNNVGLEVAEAIVRAYGSPQALLKAYSNSDTPEQLLEDLEVRRNAGILSSVRRVGPELSRKIHRFFTAVDPGAVL